MLVSYGKWYSTYVVLYELTKVAGLRLFLIKF